MGWSCLKNFLQEKLYIWKPISFLTHFFWPGAILTFLVWALPPVGFGALWVFMRYESNEDFHMDADKAFQDIQGVWVALTVLGSVLAILVLCGLIPPCPILEVVL